MTPERSYPVSSHFPSITCSPVPSQTSEQPQIIRQWWDSSFTYSLHVHLLQLTASLHHTSLRGWRRLVLILVLSFWNICWNLLSEPQHEWTFFTKQLYTDVYLHATLFESLSMNSMVRHLVSKGEAFEARLTDGFQQQSPRLQPPSLCQISITPHCTTVVELTSSNMASKLSKHTKLPIYSFIQRDGWVSCLGVESRQK